MLKADKQFQDMPYERQDLNARLAAEFIKDQGNLFKTAEELEESTSLGTVDHWHQFLLMNPVMIYIKQQMAAAAQVASRKAFLSLQQEAQAGNVQAVKQINELAGILNKADDNKVIIMHHIPRPKEENNA
jgi:hypothetical protein